MKIGKKFFIRRNLDFYSEIEFAKYLEKKDFQPFYPHRDTGIDILAVKNRTVEYYQLKARNEQARCPGIYWFQIKKKAIVSLLNLSKTKTFFVLCALQPGEKFDFFKMPVKIVEKYIKLREQTTKKNKEHFLEIGRINKGRYKIKPERISKIININKYLLTK